MGLKDWIGFDVLFVCFLFLEDVVICLKKIGIFVNFCSVELFDVFDGLFDFFKAVHKKCA